MKNRTIQYDYIPLFFLIVFLVVSFTCEIEKNEDASIYEKEQGREERAGGYFTRFINYSTNNESIERKESDLEKIKKRGKLVALTGYGPTSYFLYKATPMGFEYDLLKQLAKKLDVELEIVIVHETDKIFEMLNNGEGDIIADNLIITKERDGLVDFTLPLITTRQVLVQRKPEGWEKLEYERAESLMIRSLIDLIGQSVHVRKSSPYSLRLKNLSEEIGGDIQIIEEDAETEELMSRVAEGKISYAVAEQNIAEIYAKFYPNIDVNTYISFDQRVAWAVREDSPELLQVLNQWISKIKKDGTFRIIYNKYYRQRQGVNEMVKCIRTSMCGRKISPYDELIIKYAQEINWDWRLLASLIYQESQFNPTARSWAGACGLMQLMPLTAECFGAENPEDPHQSLRAGTKYLKWLEKYWEKKVPDKNERIKFIIASYNVGQEHVADAQRLAKKYNKDPYKWDNNVAYFIIQKSNEKFCNDPVVKYGYCRGSEPVAYVNNILERYKHYKKLIQEIV